MVIFTPSKAQKSDGTIAPSPFFGSFRPRSVAACNHQPQIFSSCPDLPATVNESHILARERAPNGEPDFRPDPIRYESPLSKRYKLEAASPSKSGPRCDWTYRPTQTDACATVSKTNRRRERRRAVVSKHSDRIVVVLVWPKPLLHGLPDYPPPVARTRRHRARHHPASSQRTTRRAVSLYSSHEFSPTSRRGVSAQPPAHRSPVCPRPGRRRTHLFHPGAPVAAKRSSSLPPSALTR